MKKLMIALIAAFIPFGLCAGTGTAAVDILKIPAGIRAQAVGGASSAYIFGADSLDSNPAGISFVKKTEFLFVHDLYFQDTFFDSLYLASGLGEAGTIAACIKYMNTGSITSTLEDSQGNYLGEGSTLTGFNYLGALGYGVDLEKWVYNDFTKDMNLGFALKFAGESLAGVYSNMAISFDAGAVYTIIIEEADFMSNRGEFLLHKVMLGFAARNLGTSFSSGITPITAVLGASAEFMNIVTVNNRLAVSLDTDYNIGNGINLRTGIDFAQRIENYTLGIRFGTNLNPEARAFSGFAAGLALGMQFEGTEYEFDYTIIPYGDLGLNQKIGLFVRI